MTKKKRSIFSDIAFAAQVFCCSLILLACQTVAHPISWLLGLLIIFLIIG